MSEQNPLPANWSWLYLEEICKAVVDCEHSTAKFASHGVPCLDTTCMRPGQIVRDKLRYVSEETYLFRIRRSAPGFGDIVFAREGTVGTAVAVPEDFKCCLGQRVMLLRPRDCIVSKFLEAALASDQVRSQYRPMILGTTSPHLNVRDVKLLRIPVAPPKEQRRIVAKIEELFSDLDAGVAALKRAKANLKRYRAAVLKAAVEGKLTEEWRAKHPETEPASKLLARILTERRQKWEADQLAKFAAAKKVPPKGWQEKYVEPPPQDTKGLPELPSGWCWANVEQIAEYTRYGSSAKTHEASDGIPVLRMGNIVDGKLDLSALKYLPFDHAEFPELLLKSGDLLFNRTNSAELVGKSAVYEGQNDPCSFASYLISVRCLSGCNSRILCIYLNSMHGKQWVKSVVSQQVGQANVNGTKLQALAFPLPSHSEQEQILAEVAEKLSQIEAGALVLDCGLMRASRLRQSILNQAFEGKLVSQDPTDEPAKKLLERIHRQHDTIKKAINGAPGLRRVGRPRKPRPALPLFTQDDSDDQGGDS